MERDAGNAPSGQPGRWQRITQWRYLDLAIVLLLLAAFLFYYPQMIDDQIIGFTHDDGVYAISAKALSEGKGFTLLHVAGWPAQTKYPVLYPLILSLGWLINPKFPENLPLLTYITLLFGYLSAVLIYFYLKRFHGFPRWLAFLVVTFVFTNFYVLFFFSTLMSEAPYLFFSLLTLWFAQKYSEGERKLSLRSVGVLVVLSGLTFHTRVTGISLIAAIGLWLLLHRQWKNAVGYGLGCLLLAVLPWVLWTKFNTPVVNEINYPLVNAYSDYKLELLENIRSGDYAATLTQAMGSYINRLLESLFTLIPNLPEVFRNWQWLQTTSGAQIYVISLLTFSYGLMGYYVMQLIAAARKGFANGKVHSEVFSIPALYLLLYSLLIIFWNYEEQMARFMTVISPLLWLYFLKPVLAHLKQFRVQPAKTLAALILIAVSAVSVLSLADGSFRTIRFLRRNHMVDAGTTRWLWNDYRESFDYINRNFPANAPYAVGTDTIYYLYTNRPTFYLFFASLQRDKGQFLYESLPRLMRSFDAYGVKYMVVEPHMRMRIIEAPMNIVAVALLKAFPERFQEIYHTSHGAITIFKILPAKQKPGAVQKK